ncbi:MAG: cobalt-precorrin-5B (C(1))-methyltransferase [Anaerolineae bacterium]|nr:cobalt-precorrin-5B (C(1))-methyltransferase [Anaerolineae bacterium]MDW8100930.1 cobalt-precorrin-5B (C(1))-methyltransferase [Anaerolineae bacterium]
MNTGRAWRRSNLRHGYTTSACAAAAAAAATHVLLTGQQLTHITIDLPAERGVTFELARCEFEGPTPTQVTCAVVKDAGDDPDVTHGAEIVATVSWRDAPGIQLVGGAGVGIVTRPGLPVPVGEPAINPGSRRIIRRAVEAVAGSALERRGLKVVISVPRGEELARQTLNPKLGIVGGISILGTDGIVRPYSQAAYRASIYTELKVAAEAGLPAIVLTTGTRSAEYARRRDPALSELACVQVGDHVGYALKQARRLGFTRAIISTMVGKASKLAQGRMQTHVSEGEVDLAFLAEIARQLGADEETVAAVARGNTAHHVQVILRRAGIVGLEQRLAELAAAQAAAFVGGELAVEVWLWSVGGELLAIAEHASRSSLPRGEGRMPLLQG